MAVSGDGVTRDDSGLTCDGVTHAASGVSSGENSMGGGGDTEGWEVWPSSDFGNPLGTVVRKLSHHRTNSSESADGVNSPLGAAAPAATVCSPTGRAGCGSGVEVVTETAQDNVDAGLLKDGSATYEEIRF